MSLVKKWVTGWAGSYAEPELGDYMFGAFMFLATVFFIAVMTFLVGLILWTALPWSIPFTVFVLVVVGAFWYAWKREQEPKTKRVKI